MIEIDKALSDRGRPSTLRLVLAAATVLVIDDDPAMVESLATVLEDHDFRVLTANDGVRGLRMFREQRPVAVLTDIMMPEQHGIETILQIRIERSEVKIIAISGAGRIGKTDFLTIARKLGADATFERGRRANELVVLLRQRCGGSDIWAVTRALRLARAVKPEASRLVLTRPGDVVRAW